MGSVRNATRLWNKHILNSRTKRKRSKSMPNIEQTREPFASVYVVKEQRNEEKAN